MLNDWNKICEVKDKIQDEGIQKWISNRARGTLEQYTGFGKTFTAKKVINKTLESSPNASIIVIVPTDKLKSDWEKFTNKYSSNIKVIIINTAVKQEYNCDLLILDEIHCYAAATFKEVFNSIRYKWILGLTATIKRKDGKHSLLLEKCPIVHKITLQEGIQLGIVANHKFINYHIKLNSDELKQYDEINKEFDKLFSYFERDMNIMHFCMNKRGATSYYYGTLEGNFQNLPDKEAIQQLTKYALFCNKAMQKREAFVQNLHRKVLISSEILSKLNVKSLVFGESSEIADEIAQRINLIKNSLIAESYHSKNTDKKNRLIFQEFDNGFIRILVSARKLIVGVDCPDIELGLATSYTSSETDFIQSSGRILRINPLDLNKLALYITLIVDDTIEERWNKHRQSTIKSNNIINVYSIEELLSIINQLKIKNVIQ